MTWQSQTRAWIEKRGASEAAENLVLFFEKAFQAPLKLYPHDAWFGVHANCVSLTLGNMWLAAIASPPNCAYLIVEQDLCIKGIGFLPIRATQKYVPLGFSTAKPWQLVHLLNENKQVWDEYARGCELLLQSPISRNVITRNLYRKARLSELRSAKPDILFEGGRDRNDT